MLLLSELVLESKFTLSLIGFAINTCNQLICLKCNQMENAKRIPINSYSQMVQIFKLYVKY